MRYSLITIKLNKLQINTKDLIKSREDPDIWK